MEPNDDTTLNTSESNLPKGNPFSVPDGYFNSLPDSILSRIAVGDFEEKPNPFTTPESYFGLLTERVMAKKKEEEFNDANEAFFNRQSETVLAELQIRAMAGTEVPFTVPEGYFDTLTERIESKARSQSGTILYFRIRRWMPAAAAAVLVMMIQLFAHPGTTSVAASNTITSDSLTTEEIALHLQKVDVDEEVLMKSVDVTSLSVYRKEAVPENDAEEQKILDEIDVNDIPVDM